MEKNAQDEKRNRVVAQAFQCRRALEVNAFSMLKDRTEAEDLVQDAFIVVMDKFEDFEEGTSMMAWTRAIVRINVLQSLEKRKRRAKILDSLTTPWMPHSKRWPRNGMPKKFEPVVSDWTSALRSLGSGLGNSYHLSRSHAP